MRARSIATRRVSSGTGHGAKCTIMSARFRRFRAPGLNFRSTASRFGSRFCALRKGRAMASPAQCSMIASRSPVAKAPSVFWSCNAPGGGHWRRKNFCAACRSGPACGSADMPRYKLLIEYDCTPFIGWQMQDSGLSVQGALMAAAAAFCGERVKVQGAGRTDTGVHALGQVAHIDLAKDWATDTVRDALTAHLRPHPIAVLATDRVPDTFDARFSARQRHYLYRIVNRRSDLALERERAWRVPRRLDEVAMGKAAQSLLGRHDFTTFRDADCQAKSPVKTLDALDVARTGDELRIGARARSFLHTQVRSMVGALVFVGDGHWTEHDLIAARDARDRAACAPLAPPMGLYLVRVDY